MLGLALLLHGCTSPPEDTDRLKPGRLEYLTHCVACHGREGLGSRHLFPPLAGSEWAQGPEEIPIRVVLHGLEGPLELQGEKYLNVMPPLGKRMTDAQIAAVLTYVRTAWGNAAPAVAPAAVTRVRGVHAGRERSWRAEDLLPLLEAATESRPAAGAPAGGPEG